MKKIGYLITKYYKVILILSILFVIPALIGMYKTKINYDILVYLPDDIETIKGEKILTDDFHTGAYAIAIIENMKDKDIISLEQKIKEIDGVSKVISIDDMHIQIVEKYMFFKYLFLLILIIRIFKHIRLLNT